MIHPVLAFDTTRSICFVSAATISTIVAERSIALFLEDLSRVSNFCVRPFWLLLVLVFESPPPTLPMDPNWPPTFVPFATTTMKTTIVDEEEQLPSQDLPGEFETGRSILPFRLLKPQKSHPTVTTKSSNC